MSEFKMKNLDLQAQVGVGGRSMENPALPFSSSFQQEEDLIVMSFPEIFETSTKVDHELLSMPFYPYSTQTSSLIPQENQNSQQLVSPNISGANKVSISAAKPKRSRKNLQNRVVQHVTADDVPSDTWAWRKYGQKPIKGSPYPRSYYKCSSSKGCLARKQVERSGSDPRIFIITYTAEHSHGHPITRRINSLAGITRTKSSAVVLPKSRLGNGKEPHDEATETVVSPTTFADEYSAQQESIKMEELQIMLEDGDDQGQGDNLTPDVMLSTDELLGSLENFEGLFLDQFPDLSHELWSMK